MVCTNDNTGHDLSNERWYEIRYLAMWYTSRISMMSKSMKGCMFIVNCRRVAAKWNWVNNAKCRIPFHMKFCSIFHDNFAKPVQSLSLSLPSDVRWFGQSSSLATGARTENWALSIATWRGIPAVQGHSCQSSSCVRAQSSWIYQN